MEVLNSEEENVAHINNSLEFDQFKKVCFSYPIPHTPTSVLVTYIYLNFAEKCNTRGTFYQAIYISITLKKFSYQIDIFESFTK